MDIAQNSITAKASLISLTMREDTARGALELVIEDNGCGMDAETLARVQSPFFSTRTTRSIGMGIPLFRMACEQTGGSFTLTSEKGRGTVVRAIFNTGHIDMTPPGNMSETVLLLITCNPALDFVYTRARDGACFTLDTRELREILGEDVSLSSPDMVGWMREFLAEQEQAL